jgi:hypothetical protein
MPLYTSQLPLPLISRNATSGTLNDTWAGVYNRVITSGNIVLNLTPSSSYIANAEIIIRVPSASGGTVTINPIGVSIDVNGSLGLTIPQGGIGELKRVGLSNNWDFYGYIE